jgi:hypothetical protein
MAFAWPSLPQTKSSSKKLNLKKKKMETFKKSTRNGQRSLLNFTLELMGFKKVKKSKIKKRNFTEAEEFHSDSKFQIINFWS